MEAALSNQAMFFNNALATANTPKQRAETLMEIQIRCGVTGEQVIRVMALAQDLIEKERYWEHPDIDRETMWKNIDYENSIEPAMERLRRTDRRCEKYEEKIVDNWGPDWRTEMDSAQTLLTGESSENMLGAIRRLSDKMTPAAVGKYVAGAIQYRLANWRRGQRNTTFATTTDFLHVLKHMSATPLISSSAGAGVVTRPKRRIEGVEENSEDDEEERAEEEEDEDVEVDEDEDVEMSEDSVGEEPVAIFFFFFIVT